MICKNCGETINEWDKFCPNCGMKVEEEVNEEFSNNSSEENVNFDNEREKDGGFQEDDNSFTGHYQHYGNGNSSGSKSGLFGFYEDASRALNEQLDGVLRWISNTQYSFWIILVGWALIMAIVASLSLRIGVGSFFRDKIDPGLATGMAAGLSSGTFVLSLIAIPITYLIAKLIFTYVSRKIDFKYGIAEEAREERNKFILFALFIQSMVELVLALIPVLRNGIIGSIIGFFLYPLYFTIVFYKYFESDKLEKFVKKYFKLQLILWAIGIGITLIFVLLGAGMFFYGLQQMQGLDGFLN